MGKLLITGITATTEKSPDGEMVVIRFPIYPGEGINQAMQRHFIVVDDEEQANG